MHVMARLFMVSAGFCCAVLAAAAFLLLVHAGPPPQAGDAATVWWVQFFVYGLATASVTGAATALPALAIIAVTETLRIRSFLVQVLCFGAAGGAISLMYGHSSDAIEANLTVMLATGIVAGAVYWLVAGRGAGWRQQ